MLLRQVGVASRGRDAERGAAIDLAAHRDRAAMQLDQIRHQGETDARALVRAGARAFDAVETLEHPRLLVLGDTDARIADAELDATVRRRAEVHADAAFER